MRIELTCESKAEASRLAVPAARASLCSQEKGQYKRDDKGMREPYDVHKSLPKLQPHEVEYVQASRFQHSCCSCRRVVEI